MLVFYRHGSFFEGEQRKGKERERERKWKWLNTIQNDLFWCIKAKGYLVAVATRCTIRRDHRRWNASPRPLQPLQLRLPLRRPRHRYRPVRADKPRDSEREREGRSMRADKIVKKKEEKEEQTVYSFSKRSRTALITLTASLGRAAHACTPSIQSWRRGDRQYLSLRTESCMYWRM